MIVEPCAKCLVRKVYLTESEVSMRRDNPRLSPICSACVERMRKGKPLLCESPTPASTSSPMGSKPAI